jgi:chorismate mutase
VETEEQVVHTAVALARHEVTLIRGGIWKPRTRPGSFEGVGPKGLEWLKAAGEATGLPVATEVATAAHVEECLKADIDVLWIGARTTTNPIMMQKIAESLAGVDIPVMVKNPINPDLELWIGGFERLFQSGVKRVVAVHRGFSTHTRRKYRNQPLWGIPLELRRRLPHIPLLCDPSHICGNRRYIASIAQDAMDSGFDGLMIESHWSPETALSDAEQQLTPLQYGRLIRELVKNSTQVEHSELELRNLQREIEEIDEDLSVLFAKRVLVGRALERYRNKKNSLTRTWARICADRCNGGMRSRIEDKEGPQDCEACPCEPTQMVPSQVSVEKE